MGTKDLSTQEKLLKIGKEEFLAKGFKDASLREIVQKAGFTLGAFYGYYDSKEALFDDLVKEPATLLYDRYLQTQTEFAQRPTEEQVDSMDQAESQGLAEMIDILYDNFDAFKLVFFRSTGTKYENYVQQLIDIEVHHTQRFIRLLQAQGYPIDIDEELIHILSSALLTGMFEVIDHDMTKEKAARYVDQLRVFYSTGWQKLMGY